MSSMRPPMLAGPIDQRARATLRLRFRFLPVTTRGVRVVQTASAEAFWSIAEMRVYNQGRELPRSPLWRLGAQPNGREALYSAGVSEFEPGDSVSYDDVWDFLQRYRRALGPLPDRMVAR